MVQRRSRFFTGLPSPRMMPGTVPLPMSTRSSMRSSAFGSPYYKRSFDDDVLYVPHRPSFVPHHSFYDSTANEYTTRSDINRELIMTNAAMQDNYDITNRSRKRDRDVLAAANRAIVDTELHSSPRSAAAALRVTRGQSTPPASIYSRNEVHVAFARASPNKLRYSVPPASYSSMPHRPRSPRVTVRPRYRHWFPRSMYYTRSTKMVRERSPDTTFEEIRRAPHSLLAYLRNLELALHTGRFRARSAYVPVRRSHKRKAALLANKVEVNLPERKGRRPRSSFAQAKMRHLRNEKHLGEGATEATVQSVEATSGLKAHAPVRLLPPRRIWKQELSYRYTA